MGFAADLARVCERAGDKADLVVRKTAIEMGSAMILKSPVDTGRFRANWQTGLGTMNRSTGDAPDRSGAAALAALTASLTAWQPGQTIWITNSISYAQRLERGYSKQAPLGVVATTVVEFEQFFREAAASVK